MYATVIQYLIVLFCYD